MIDKSYLIPTKIYRDKINSLCLLSIINYCRSDLDKKVKLKFQRNVHGFPRRFFSITPYHDVSPQGRAQLERALERCFSLDRLRRGPIEIQTREKQTAGEWRVVFIICGARERANGVLLSRETSGPNSSVKTALRDSRVGKDFRKRRVFKVAFPPLEFTPSLCIEIRISSKEGEGEGPVRIKPKIPFHHPGNEAGELVVETEFILRKWSPRNVTRHFSTAGRFGRFILSAESL